MCGKSVFLVREVIKNQQGANQILHDTFSLHDSVTKKDGWEGVNLNVTCHFLSLFELNITTKSLEKAMFFVK